MKKILVYMLVLIFVMADVSKWFLDVGFRVNYYVPPLLLWLGIAAIYLARGSLHLPRPIQALILFKGAHLACMLATLPMVFATGAGDMVVLFMKGFYTEAVKALAVIALLLFAVRLERTDWPRVVDLYLVAITVCACYTLVEVVAAYGFGFDLDVAATRYMPLWLQEAPSIEEDIYGFGDVGKIYRFSGLTCDPNLNGVIFAVALPWIYQRGSGKNWLLLAVLALVCYALIVLTVSNTAMPLAAVLFVLLTWRYFGKAKRFIAVTFVGVLIGGALFVSKFSLAITETLGYRWDREGTSEAHATLAQNALSIWMEHPTGVGFNAYSVYSPENGAHNSYLTSLAELGLPGLLVTLGLVGYSLWLCFRTKNDLGFSALLSVGALALAANGHDLLFRPEFQFFLNLMVAIVVMSREQVLEPVAAGAEPVPEVAGLDDAAPARA